MFGSKKQQIIKFNQNLCNAKIDDNGVLFVRVDSIIKDKGAQIEVPFTHVALLLKSGGDCKLYKSGVHAVFESRQEVKNWKKGESVEVIYMPIETSVPVEWGVRDLTCRDFITNIAINVGASGSFGVSIANPELFFRKVVGVQKEFDVKKFQDRFSALVSDEFSSAFLTAVEALGLSYDKFDANKKRIAREIEMELSRAFEQRYGIFIQDFFISTVVALGTEAIEKELGENRDVRKYNDDKYRKYRDAQKAEREFEWKKEQFYAEQKQKKEERELEASLRMAEIEANIKIESMKGTPRNSDGTYSNELPGPELYKRVINGVCEFTCIMTGSNMQSRGSGLLIDKQKGLVITNTHVIANDDTGLPVDEVYVKIAGVKGIRAKVLMIGDDKAGKGKGVDLALVQLSRVPEEAVELKFCSPSDVENGETVYIVGNAKGEGTSITKGIVSDKRHYGGKYIMTDCPVNHGNSGGPIFNARALSIGVVVAKYQGADIDNMGFIIPVNTVAEFLEGKHCVKKFF